MRLITRLSMVAAITAGLTAAGCGAKSGDKDGIWYPPGQSGKADSSGFGLVKGSDIPSRYADPAKSYLATRWIDTLGKVGVDPALLALAARIDGVLVNLPADGNLQLAELVRMEAPAIFSHLFPEEQARIPLLSALPD